MTQVAAPAAARAAAPPSLEGASLAQRVLLLIAISAAVRVLLAAAVGLSVDESYTVAVSRQLEWSYFDHPPLHLWLVGEWARLLGSEAPVVVRLPFIALFALSTWLLYRLTARAFGERSGWWAALALNITPQLTLAAASWVLPDGPMMCCALLSVWCVSRALADRSAEAGPKPSPRWWLLAGVAAGLALLSKYLAGFVLLGVAGYLLSSRDRRALATAAPWGAALLAALMLTPVLIWNAQHQWASFAFQGGRALPAGWSLKRFATDFGGQLAYLLPWTGVALLWSLWHAWRAGPADRGAWLFAWLASGPIVFFTLLGLWTPVLPHWPMIGWLFAFPLLGRMLARLELRHPRAVRASVIASAALLLGLLGVAAGQARSGWIDRYAPSFVRSDPTVDLLDWRALGAALAQRHALRPGMAVMAVSWIDAGKLDYALGATHAVICLGSDPRQFGFLQRPGRFEGSEALLVANAQRRDWLRLAAPYFDHLEPLPDVVLQRAGQPALVLHVARGIDFHMPNRS